MHVMLRAAYVRRQRRRGDDAAALAFRIALGRARQRVLREQLEALRKARGA